MNEMIRRQRAAQATLAKFRNKVFDWRAGITCVHLARFHLRKMGHHPPSLPRIRSALAAKRALTERGWSSVTDMLDSLLQRITPAEMLLGDLAVAESNDEFGGAIFLCAGPHKLLGWREDAPALVVLDVRLDEISAAWRV